MDKTKLKAKAEELIRDAIRTAESAYAELPAPFAQRDADEAETDLTAFVEALCEAADVLKELRNDEWRCTVDWGPRDEREIINDRCNAALSRLEELTK